MVMFILGIFFVGSIQPIVMVSSLIVMTLLYSYCMNLYMEGYWFSYALVMVMLSGILVIFTYMVSLVPNEMFENYNLIMIFMMMIMMMVNFEIFYLGDMSYMCLSLWGSYISFYNLFMVGFLFGVMLMVVWISCIDSGAMRV
uniref:NADH dehydrogenase subunit 6 n=1 Tax=Plator insolens TaxID=2880587 RepID=UPI001F14705E|nr:NADH dehydrogenase subunit 6 [Plator insolens]UMI39153.1 NADH dehydrogenase subunit 6 [Plator insolens]